MQTRKVMTMIVTTSTEQKTLFLSDEEVTLLPHPRDINPKEGWKPVSTRVDSLTVMGNDPQGSDATSTRGVFITFRRDVKADQPAAWQATGSGVLTTTAATNDADLIPRYYIERNYGDLKNALAHFEEHGWY